MFLKGIFLFSIFIFFNPSFAFKASDSYPGLVKLIRKDGNGMIAQGTGFFISPDTLLTANHVVGKSRLYFRDAELDEPVLTEVVGSDKEYDIALLRAIDYERKDFYSLGSRSYIQRDLFSLAFYKLKGRFYSNEAQTRQAVIIPGFPQNSFNIIKGIIIDYQDFYSLVQVTYKTDPEMFSFSGMSGSPVFSENRELIGLVILQSIECPLFSERTIGFVPLEIVRHLLRRANGIRLGSEDLAENLFIKTMFSLLKTNRGFDEELFLRTMLSIQDDLY